MSKKKKNRDKKWCSHRPNRLFQSNQASVFFGWDVCFTILLYLKHQVLHDVFLQLSQRSPVLICLPIFTDDRPIMALNHASCYAQIKQTPASLCFSTEPGAKDAMIP